jgi:peptidoglycan/LPS O-acetylase OafA/YrhL
MEKRLVQLDGLRAIAIAFVLIAHFPPTHYFGWKVGIPFGILGVRLFFVLSGYLITRILLQQKATLLVSRQKRLSALFSFYMRRFLRIFPIFYLTIIIACFLDVGQIRDVVWWHLAYLSNLEPAIFYHFSGASRLKDPTTGHFWSLAVEEQFYLIWPTIVLFASMRGLTKVLLTIAVLAVLWRAIWILCFPMMPSLSLLGCLDTLGAGALLALSVHTKEPGLASLLKRIAICGGAIVVACSIALKFGVFWRPSIILIDLGAALLFPYLVYRASLNTQDYFGKFLQQRWLVYIGKISYGIYIYHAFMTPLKEWGWTYLSLPPVGAYSLVTPFVTTALTLIVASLSWFLVETPLNRLKRFFPRYDLEVKPSYAN